MHCRLLTQKEGEMKALSDSIKSWQESLSAEKDRNREAEITTSRQEAKLQEQEQLLDGQHARLAELQASLTDSRMTCDGLLAELHACKLTAEADRTAFSTQLSSERRLSAAQLSDLQLEVATLLGKVKQLTAGLQNICIDLNLYIT